MNKFGIVIILDLRREIVLRLVKASEIDIRLG